MKKEKKLVLSRINYKRYASSLINMFIGSLNDILFNIRILYHLLWLKNVGTKGVKKPSRPWS